MDEKDMRDWFAGQPDIAGSLALISKDVGEALCGPAPDGEFNPLEAYKWQAKVQAAVRYIAADAMLEARK